jgi:hypothetical protein
MGSRSYRSWYSAAGFHHVSQNGTYSQWLYITSNKPQRLDGSWTRSGKRYRIEHSGLGDYFILKEGYLLLGDEEGGIRGYRRLR